MQPQDRRLKRGLKDISNIFVSPEAAMPQPNERKDFFVKTVAVLNPENFGDTYFLNSYIAALTAAQECPSVVLSIGEQKSGDRQSLERSMKTPAAGVPQFSMPWEEFETLSDQPFPKHYSGSQPRQMIFLNADYSQSSRVVKLAGIIDKCILVLSPSVESLMEGYRFIKMASRLNQKIQFHLAFEGMVQEELGCFLFERYAGILSKHLGINLVWLGRLDPLRGFEGESADLELDPLFLKDMPGAEDPAKITLAEFVASHLYQLSAEEAS